MPFNVVVVALDADGDTATDYSGAVGLSASSGQVTPETVSLTAGAGTADVRVTGAEGEISLDATAGGADGLATLRVIAANDLLEGDPGDPAPPAIPGLEFDARGQDYDTTHPDLGGLPLSFNTLLLTPAAGATVADLNGLIVELDATIVGGLTGHGQGPSGILFLRLPTTTHAEMETVLDTLRASGHVEVAVQDALLAGTALPRAGGGLSDWDWNNEPGNGFNGIDGNWGMELIRAPQLWNLNGPVQKLIDEGQTMAPITGVLDLGFASDHTDLPAFEANQTPGVVSAHGTHVAGIIAARHDNAMGVDGINPFAKLVVRADTISVTGVGPIPEQTSFGEAFIKNLDQMVRAQPDLKVVNMSLGYAWEKYGANGINTSTNVRAQDLARTQGAAFRTMLQGLESDGYDLPILVVSSGNGSALGFGPQDARYASPMANTALEPPYSANIIVVEADSLDLMAPGGARRLAMSNVNGLVSAPGDLILSTVPAGDGLYAKMSGTSMAAPLVAGLVGYLYTLDPGLDGPTLTSNPALDVLNLSLVPVGGSAAGRIDAFGAAMALDEYHGNDRVIRLLLDIDDGTPDGNTRVDRWELGEDDQDDIGDGEIDMSDFRRWRDWLLQLRDEPGLALDGPTDHFKKDVNADSVVDTREATFPRGDFNADTLVDDTVREYVGGAVQGDKSDLEVLEQFFDDPHYDSGDLSNLIRSMDLQIWPQQLAAEIAPDTIHSIVRRADTDAVLEPERTHTGTLANGEQPRQVYTLPEVSAGYTARLVGINGVGDTVFDDTETFPFAVAGDTIWDPPAGCETIDSYLWLRTQADVNAAAGICEITGNLSIDEDTLAGDPIVDLSPLRSLSRVGGGLQVLLTRQLATLAGLENVTFGTGQILIGENLALQDLNGLATNASGPASDITLLNVSRNDALTSIVGLDNVLPAQAQIGEVRIEENPALGSLAGLEKLGSAGNVFIDDDPALSTVSGLSGLGDVSYLRISGTDVGSVSLASLGKVVRVTIGLNPSLTSVALTASTLDHYDGANNDDLASITLTVNDGGMSTGVNVTGNPSLSDVSVTVSGDIANLLLSSIPAINEVTISGGDITGTLQVNETGFEALPTLPVADTLSGSLLITNNASLADIEKLNSIKAVGSPDDSSYAPNLRVDDNPALCVPAFIYDIELLGLGGSSITNNKTDGC